MPQSGSQTIQSVLCLVLTSCLVYTCSGCFEWDDHDIEGYSWAQKQSFNQELVWRVDLYTKPDVIEITQQRTRPKNTTVVKCLKKYPDKRYLVEVEESSKTYYQCVQLKTLSKYVMKQYKTNARTVQHELDCDKDIYDEDEAVIYAKEVSEPCPLTGGYQMIMHQSEAIGSACFDDVTGYNPRIQFECDASGSGGVHVQFGFDCMPVVLGGTKKMRGHHMSKLYCVGSWNESGYDSILLRMENEDRDLDDDNPWCLHYTKQIEESNSPRAVSKGEEFLSFFITFDGRCRSRAFESRMTNNASTYGFLASYRPENDIKCTDKGYLKDCESKDDICFESSECPRHCHRCIKSPQHNDCAFNNQTMGHWKLLQSFSELEVDIDVNSLKSDAFGEFTCRGPSEKVLSGEVFPVYQKGFKDTCMQYDACVEMTSLAPGILAFNVISAARHDDSGETLTCKETLDLMGNFKPLKLQETKTLINEKLLQEVPCGIEARTYPTVLNDCDIAVTGCEGDCTTFKVDFDQSTCQHNGSSPFNIVKEHKCFARIEFDDGVFGILAQNVGGSGSYKCWIFLSARLFVTDPEKCNRQSVNYIIRYDAKAARSYDPFNAISGPIIVQVGSALSAAKSINNTPYLFEMLMCLFWTFVMS